ncbi:MAG: MFS transporter [Opitutales bacterium]|nr:MFS transporter [Opitutales bacterium]
MKLRRLESHEEMYKWMLLALLWVAYFIHQGSRQIYPSILPQIKEYFGEGSSAKMGAVMTAFAFTYGVTVLFSGLASDFLRRKWMIVFGVLTFCTGIFLSGFVASIGLMIFTYGVLNGLGQGCYYPPASSLLGQHFEKNRSTAFSILQTAQYLGIIVCSLFAGYIGNIPNVGGFEGWRLAFFSVGGAGIIWALVLAFLMRYSRELMAKKSAGEDAATLKDALLVMVRKPSAIILGLVFGMNVCIDIGYKTWMPDFLQEVHGLEPASAAFNAVIWSYIGAFIGIMIGCRITDRLAARGRKVIRFETTSVGFLLTAPFAVLMAFLGSDVLCYVSLFFFGFSRGVYDSSLFASLFDVVQPKYRATGMGIMLCFGFIIGSVSPTVLGWIRDMLNPQYAIASLSVCCLSAVALLMVAKFFFFNKDYEES